MNTILATCCTGNRSKHSFNPYTLCRWKLVTNPFSKFAMTAFRDVYFSVTNRADLGKKKSFLILTVNEYQLASLSKLEERK